MNAIDRRIVEATVQDIPAMHYIRMRVKENALNNPDLVKENDYIDFITTRGKGWVYRVNGKMYGFAIVDMKAKNVWALFVDPDHAGEGAGRALHDQMINWYFSQTNETIWLGTAPNTRAEKFYRKAGWIDKGMRTNGEVHFEMTVDKWQSISPKSRTIR